MAGGHAEEPAAVGGAPPADCGETARRGSAEDGGPGSAAQGAQQPRGERARRRREADANARTLKENEKEEEEEEKGERIGLKKRNTDRQRGDNEEDEEFTFVEPSSTIEMKNAHKPVSGLTTFSSSSSSSPSSSSFSSASSSAFPSPASSFPSPPPPAPGPASSSPRASCGGDAKAHLAYRPPVWAAERATRRVWLEVVREGVLLERLALFHPDDEQALIANEKKQLQQQGDDEKQQQQQQQVVAESGADSSSLLVTARANQRMPTAKGDDRPTAAARQTEHSMRLIQDPKSDGGDPSHSGEQQGDIHQVHSGEVGQGPEMAQTHPETGRETHRERDAHTHRETSDSAGVNLGNPPDCEKKEELLYVGNEQGGEEEQQRQARLQQGRSFFILGSKKGMVDVLYEHPYVSRQHLVLQFGLCGSLFALDFFSRFGSRLRAEALAAGAFHKLKLPAQISLAPGSPARRRFLLVDNLPPPPQAPAPQTNKTPRRQHQPLTSTAPANTSASTRQHANANALTVDHRGAFDTEILFDENSDFFDRTGERKEEKEEGGEPQVVETLQSLLQREKSLNEKKESISKEVEALLAEASALGRRRRAQEDPLDSYMGETAKVLCAEATAKAKKQLANVLAAIKENQKILKLARR
eukprot:GHVT01016603.1.p1 GENE.GHVT01016603.1~~GHVT01016603.1.p1  ORF type:complete len:643 (+),score=202.48 GHVT01016603.1:119-2047(+)